MNIEYYHFLFISSRSAGTCRIHPAIMSIMIKLLSCGALRDTGRSGRCSLRPHPLCKDLSLDGEGINNCAEIMPQRKSNIKHDARCTRRSTCKFFTIKCSWVDVLHAVLPSSCGISPLPLAKPVKSCHALKVVDGLWFPRNDYARKWKNSPKSWIEFQ